MLKSKGKLPGRILLFSLIICMLLLFIPTGAFADDPPKSDGTLLKQDFESGLGNWSITKSSNGVAEIVTHTGSNRLHLKAASLTDSAYICSGGFTNPNSTYIVEFDYFKPSGVTTTDWHIYGVWNSGIANWSDIRILNTGSTLTIYHGNGYTNLNYTMPTGRWLHFTIRKESVSSIRVFIDGVDYGSYTPLANSINMTNISYIGDPSASGYQGEGYWDNFSIGLLSSDPSNVVFADDFESGSITGWSMYSGGSGLVECAKLGNTFALHISSRNLTDQAGIISPYFAMDNPKYSFEFDYYKPSGIAAKDWHIFGSWNNLSNWNDIRILQSDDVTQGAITIYYGSSQCTLGYTLPTDKWVRFLISKNSAGNIELYINGIYQGTYAPLSTSSGNSMNFGHLGDPSNNGYYGEGYWDNFKVATATNSTTIYTTDAYSSGGAKTVQIATPGSILEFCADSTSSPYAYPGFTENSNIRSMNLMDTNPNYHTGGLRWAGRAYNSTLQCHVPFKMEVVGINQKISAFKAITNTDSFNPLKARTTYYVFKDLPEVILIDTDIERVIDASVQPNGYTTYVYSLQFYAKGSSYGTVKYNGARFWFNDSNPPGLPWFSGTGTEAYYSVNPDGTNGVFLKWVPRWDGDFSAVYWNPQQITKGLAEFQADNSTNWSTNPPAGVIYDSSKSWGHYSNTNTDYFGYLPCINISTLSNVGDRDSNQVLFYAARNTGNLTDMSKIYNLEESYKYPLAPEQLELSTDSRPVVRYTDIYNKSRNWQIVVMPPEYNKIITSMSNIFKGQAYDTYATHTVALLKDVTANSTTTIGELPIYLARNSDTSYSIDNRCDSTVKSVKVKITIPQGSTVSSVTHGNRTVTDYTVVGDELSYIRDIASGITSISIQYQ